MAVMHDGCYSCLVKNLDGFPVQIFAYMTIILFPVGMGLIALSLQRNIEKYIGALKN